MTQPVHDDDCLPQPAVLSGDSADTCDHVTQPSAVFATTFLLPAAVQLSPAVDEQDQSTTLATESVTAAAAAESECLQTFAIADEVQHECIPAKKSRNEKPVMAAGESKSKKVRTTDGVNRCTGRKKTAKENTVSAVKCYECGIVENSRADFNLRQDWIQCCKPGCGMWCHESCGETGGLVNELFFVCSKCALIE
jgi:hypothetical protein